MLRPRPRPPLFPYTTLFRSTAAAAPPGTPRSLHPGAPAEPRGHCDRWPYLSFLRAAFTLVRRARLLLSGFPASSLRSEEHTSELQSQSNLVCRLLLEKKKT